jgi:Subtilase family
VAPGASLVGLNVVGSAGFAFSSTILQAIDYAVTTGRADVIHESFGGPGYFGQNAFPTVGLDPIALANDAAVAAGVTVVTATGQSGPASTIGSPAVDPRVISVGATTSYRARAQAGTGGVRGLARSWVSGNPSATSSGGVTALGRVPDLVAPGEDGWSVCTADPVRYRDCKDLVGEPSPLRYFGGTTLASATVAGAAALVVQAYRRAHDGQRPAPALVKRILTSSATDLGVPATQQGAGQLDSYRAVQLAASTGDGLLVTAGAGDTQLTATGPAGATRDLSVQVTNTARLPQLVLARGRTLGRTLGTVAGSVPLDVTAAATPALPDGSRYATATVAVPAGTDQLTGDLAWPGGTANGQSPVGVALIDPAGRYQAFSDPRGAGNHGRVDVRRPAAGRWTAVFLAPAAATGFHGTVSYEFRALRWTAFGSVSPAVQLVLPGRTATFRVRAALPATAGDLSAAVAVTGSLGTRTSVPVTLRTLVADTFAGEITGGNGYDNPGAQTFSYAFDVPAGRRDVSVDLTLQGDPNQRVTAALAGPDGQVRTIATNQSLSAVGVPTVLDSLQGHVAAPPPGRSTLFVNIDNPVSGTAVRVPFRGHIRYDTVDVRVAGLPQGTVPAGRPVPVTLTVTNTGVTPARFFADPRLTTEADYRLLPFAGSKETNPLPLPATEPGPVWLVPTWTSALTVRQASTAPADFDLAPVNGGIPEYYGAPQGDGLISVAEVRGERINQGLWNGVSSPVGPTAGPVTGTTTLTAAVRTRAFDPAATSTTGDAWLLGIAPQPFAPLLLQPGQTGTITVTVTPTGAPGSTVRAALHVDTFAVSTFLLGGSAVDEVAVLPYEYTVG